MKDHENRKIYIWKIMSRGKEKRSSPQAGTQMQTWSYLYKAPDALRKMSLNTTPYQSEFSLSLDSFPILQVIKSQGGLLIHFCSEY